MVNAQYKCPSCSAPIEFEPSSGLMACQWCLSKFPVAEVEQFNRKLQEATGGGVGDAPTWLEAEVGVAEGTAAQSEVIDDFTGMESLVCNSCGAQIVADPTEISMRCGFCNNTFVAHTRIESTAVPDAIIPFAIDKNGMLAAFDAATKGKWLLPGPFKDRRILAEATGAYLPYWFHDGEVSGTVTMEASDRKSWIEGREEVIETTTYQLSRDASSQFRAIPVCGTTKLDPIRAAGVEPFNVADSTDFGSAYLSGYAAHTFDIQKEETIAQADKRAKEAFVEMVRGSVREFGNVTVTGANLTVKRTGIWYLLLPVWLIVIAYEGVNYPFAVNGQTGEVIGEFPISRKRLKAFRLAFFIPFMLIFGWLGYMLMSVLVA